MSSASFYKWRVIFGGMNASMISEMKDMAEGSRRLKRMHAEMSMQNVSAEGGRSEKALRPSQRNEIAENAVSKHGVRMALGCRTFEISETYYRYERRLSNKSAEIADWPVRPTANRRSWGFGL